MKASRTKYTFLNSIAGMLVQIVTILVAFVTRTVFIKTLGIQYAGVSGVFSNILTVLSFAEMGIGSAIIYALFKPIAENDERQIAKLMNAYKRIYSAIAFVILVLGLCLIPFLGFIVTDVPDIVEDIRLIYVLYLINTASSYLLIYKASFLTAAQKDYLVSKAKIAVAIGKAVVECVVLLATHNFILYLLISIFTQVVQNTYIAKVAEREYPVLKSKTSEGLSKEERGRLVKDVKALFMYKVSGTILDGTDSIVISSFIGTSFVGILGNYNLIVNQVYSFVMQIFTATSASIGNLAATSSKEHQKDVFNRMLFLCFWIYCFCATSLWTLLNPFMTIWQGEKLLFSSEMVLFLVMDFWMKGMLSPISQFRTSNGLFVQGQYRPLIMALINIVVSIFLVKRIGITGVILGTIISRVTTQNWYDPYLVYKYVFKSSVWEYYINYLIYGSLTVGSCWMSSHILSTLAVQNGFLKLFVGAALSVVVPNAVIVLLFFNTKKFNSVIDLGKKMLRRSL